MTQKNPKFIAVASHQWAVGSDPYDAWQNLPHGMDFDVRIFSLPEGTAVAGVDPMGRMYIRFSEGAPDVTAQPVECPGAKAEILALAVCHAHELLQAVADHTADDEVTHLADATWEVYERLDDEA